MGNEIKVYDEDNVALTKLLSNEYECVCVYGQERLCEGCQKQLLVDEVKRLRALLEVRTIWPEITLTKTQENLIGNKQYKNNVGDWGGLPQEPCRFCRKVGGVIFQVNEGQKNLCDPQVVICKICGKDWIADSPLA